MPDRDAERPATLNPAVSPIPLSRPPVDDELKRAVLAAIDSRQYILGPECRALEAELARATDVKHAVLTSSATAALWLTLRALGVKAGDEILVPSHTAFPTVEAICLAEATPVFVDADEFYTIDAADAGAKVTSRTVGVVPVHLYGQPADLDAVQDLASRLGLWIVEDCAQAQGAEWNGRRVGGFGRAAEWLNAVREGRFFFNGQELKAALLQAGLPVGFPTQHPGIRHGALFNGTHHH